MAQDVAPAVDRHRLALLEANERTTHALLDVLIQRLFALGLTVQSVASAIGAGDQSGRLTGAVGGIDETIRQIREQLARAPAGAVPSPVTEVDRSA